MPITNDISKPQLRALAEDLATAKANNPDAKIDDKQLDKLLSIVGDDWFTSSSYLSARFETMTLDEKVALARGGVSRTEKSDLVAFATDPAISTMLTANAAAALSALAGTQFGAAVSDPAPAGPVAGSAAAAGNMTFTPEQLAAVQKFKDVVSGGRLRQFYEAVTDTVDNPALKAEAMELFNSLPPMSPTSNPQSFVDAGLWTQAPKGIEEMKKTARYLPGRQVLVKTTVNSEVFDGNDFLKFQDGGREGITYRATIAGEDGDDFLVKVDGRDDPIKVAKEELYKLNQPHDIMSVKSGEHTYRFGSTSANYDDPFTKAKVAEAALAVAEIVEKIDYTKMATDADGGLVGRIAGSGREEIVKLQRRAVGEIHDVINMKYPKGSSWQEPGRKRGSNLGRQAMKGAGVCFSQQGVMLGMLAPFKEALGVDIQAISGGVYRNIRDRGRNPFSGGAHGWLQLTYRPSMELRIVDRTWQQADHPADRAYSRWGDRYPAGFIRSFKHEEVGDTDVNMSGDISVETFDRQFGVQGSDGRDNHMSLNQ